MVGGSSNHVKYCRRRACARLAICASAHFLNRCAQPRESTPASVLSASAPTGSFGGSCLTRHTISSTDRPSRGPPPPPPPRALPQLPRARPPYLQNMHPVGNVRRCLHSKCPSFDRSLSRKEGFRKRAPAGLPEPCTLQCTAAAYTTRARHSISNVKRMILQLACSWEAGLAAGSQGSAPVKGAGAAAAKPRGRLLALRAALNALTAPADSRRRRRRRHAAGVAFGAPRMLPRMRVAGLVGPARLPGRRGSPATSVAQLVLLQGDQRQP